MVILLVIASLSILLLVLWDAFETMVLPRRVTRRVRLARIFYRGLWFPWRTIALAIPSPKIRASFLSAFGPLSILLLVVCWMTGLTLGFAMLHWSFATAVNVPEETIGWASYLYMSGTTIFTLGLGDVVPLDSVGRFLAVVEAGTGFGFLAVVIGYLPVLYQAFSRRETIISLLDARAGSPPAGGELLLRMARGGDLDMLKSFLRELEHWSAEVLESQLSFPVLSYYRSQHDNQSWLAALTAQLDACAMAIALVKGVTPYQAQLTFAMGRHAVVDLALVFGAPPRAAEKERLPTAELAHLRDGLQATGVSLHEIAVAEAKLTELRGMYEPFLASLGDYFLFTIPPAYRASETVDNWQTSAWTRRTAGIGKLAVSTLQDDHFV